MRGRTLISSIVFTTLLFSGAVVHAIDISTNSNITITAQVGSDDDGGSGSGGGGGGGGIGDSTVVNFSGMGYPLSKVVILRDGVIAATTLADPTAKFSVSLTGFSTGTYTFGVYTEDQQGHHSVTFSFPVYITSGTTVNIGGIILSPTISVDKSQVKKGENLAIFGYSVPNSQITITVNSDVPHLLKTKTALNGVYLYNFDTSPLEYGSHTANSRAILEDQISATSNNVPFSVGTQSVDVPVGECGTIRGDINCDSKVNLVDFSVMAYWYRRASPPAGIDLNGDGTITLVDFSILAFNWTG